MKRSSGGLNLPSVATFYKKLQVSRQCQLLTCPDPCVRRIAEQNLQCEETAIRRGFRPALEVREAMRDDPGGSRKALKKRATTRVSEGDDDMRSAGLLSLPKQGHMIRSCPPESIGIWAKAVSTLSSDELRFILNATVDTLPHNYNLCLWKKKPTSSCLLCEEDQTLIHVLNCCKVARDLRRYNQRHDAVLKIIAETIKKYLPSSSTSLAVDLGDEYSFPTHIVSTDLRPDIVWWDDLRKTMVLVELTIPFDTALEGAKERKEAKYEHIQVSARSKGYHTSLITLEIGSRGIPNMPGFEALQNTLQLPSPAFHKLLMSAIKATIEGSFFIWVQRNKLN